MLCKIHNNQEKYMFFLIIITLHVNITCFAAKQMFLWMVICYFHKLNVYCTVTFVFVLARWRQQLSHALDFRCWAARMLFFKQAASTAERSG